MRVLFLIHSLSSGGAERATANLANHWASNGWQVTIVTLARQESDFYRLHPGVRRISLGVAGESKDVCRAAWNNLRRVRAVRAALRSTSPQVAVGMMTTANVLLAIAARGIRGLICIGSERSHPPMMPLDRLWHVLRQHSYGQLDAVVALTTEGAEWLRTHTNSKRVVVIPNGIPWPLPRQSPVLSVDRFVAGDRRLLLAVGRLDRVKGFDMLISAFSRIAHDHPCWDLVILGEGPLRGVLEAQILNLGLTERVLLPGRAGNVGDWYDRADLYVLSSRFEGFPNTLVEAMASGLPAVSFDCDTGPRDIVRHGLDGLLVSPEDLSGLATALGRLMRDDELRTGYSARAIEARERFSLGRIAAMWEQLFEDLQNPEHPIAAP